MTTINLPMVYWWLTSRAKQLGAWGLLGLLLTIASLLFYQVKVRPLAQQRQATQAAQLIAQSTTATALENIAVAQPAETNLQQTSMQQMDRFYARFPSAEQLPEALALMNRLASQKRLALNSGDYKLTQLKQSKTLAAHTLTKYEVVLPVTGQYPQIRSYLDEVLYQLPALALTDMQLQRENTRDARIEAKLVFVLFVKGASW